MALKFARKNSKKKEEEEKVIHGPIVDFSFSNTSVGQECLNGLRKVDPCFLLMIDGTSGNSITAGETLEKTINVAYGYLKLGLKKTDRIAFIISNSIEANIAMLAALVITAIPCVLDVSSTDFEYSHFLKVLQPTVIVCERRAIPAVEQAVNKINCNALMISLGFRSLDKNVTAFQDLLDNMQKPSKIKKYSAPSIKHAKSTPCMVCFSSGTSGLPKGVELSQYGCLYEIWKCRELCPFPGPMLHTSNLFWISGMIQLWSGICCGVQRILIRNNSESNILKMIDRYRPKFTVLTPIFLSSISRHPEVKKYNLSSLIAMYVGGAPLTQGILDDAKRAFPNMNVFGTYATTESGGVISSTNPDLNCLSGGMLSANCKLKIASYLTGETYGPLKDGEIFVQSPGMMMGYFGNYEATKDVLINGWYKTGDTGYYSPYGILYVTGRVKGILKVDDKQVSPEEIEAVICTLSDVRDAAVVGIANGLNNELFALVIKEKDSNIAEQTIKNAVANKLASFKHLSGGVVFVDSLPRNKTGKLDRRLIASIATELCTFNKN